MNHKKEKITRTAENYRKGGGFSITEKSQKPPFEKRG
jgi:hypothetical protein